MTIFTQTTSFNRGEVSDSLYDTGDPDIQNSACKRLSNWFVDTTGAAIRRPGFELLTTGTAPGTQEHMVYVEFRNWSIIVLFFVNGTTNELEIQYIDLNDVMATPVALFTVELGENLPQGFELSQIITYAQFGPSVFFASEIFPPLRLFFPLSFTIGEAFAPQVEQVVFYEELFGLTTATQGSNAWVGQDTIYVSQLNVGDIILFRGELYEIATVVDDNNFTTTTVYTDQTFTDTLAVQRDSTSRTQLTGTVTITSPLSVSLSGTATSFTTELNPGDFIEVNGVVREVDTITNDELLTVTQQWLINGTGLLVFRLGQTPFTLANPRLVTVYQGRLVYLSSNDKPTGVWASKPNDPFVLFGSGVNDDSPVNAEVIADGLDEIIWAVAQDRIYMGSRVGEYSIGSPDEPLTPANFGVRKIGATGNYRVPAIAVGTDVFHINPNQDQMYFTRFDEQLQNFQSDDLSALAPHLLEPGVVSLVYQNSSQTDRTPRFWLRMRDNSIATIALAPRNNVIAWTPLITGGPHAITQVTASPTQTFLLARDAVDPTTYYLLRLAPPTFPYSMDFFSVFTPVDGVNIVQEVYWGYTVVLHSAEKGALGTAAVSASGELDLTPFGTAEELGDITIGFYFGAVMELLASQASDGFKGGLLNRKRRLVRTIISIRETNQLLLNGQPVLSAVGQTLGSDLSPQNGKFPVRTLGWANEDRVVVETANIYPAKVLSIVREIGS